MIQDIAPYQYHNEYCTLPPDGNCYILCYHEKEVLIRRQDDEIDFPRFSQLEEENPGIYEDCQFLFTINEDRFYMVQNLNWSVGEDYAMENMEVFREAKPRHLAFAGITGAQLYRWYRSRRYCGGCGELMVHSDKERMVYCPKCGQVEYPKLSPAVIVAVTHGNRLLMSKYAGRAYKKYALLAGFTEIGETVEETVQREVMEEVGIKVKNIRYYKCQPWSFSDTLLFGFYADLDGGEEITLDEEELALAEWFEREEIPVTASGDSLTNEMIMKFKNGEI